MHDLLYPCVLEYRVVAGSCSRTFTDEITITDRYELTLTDCGDLVDGVEIPFLSRSRNGVVQTSPVVFNGISICDPATVSVVL